MFLFSHVTAQKNQVYEPVCVRVTARHDDDVVFLLHPPIASLTEQVSTQYGSVLTLEGVIVPSLGMPHRAPLPRLLCQGVLGHAVTHAALLLE